MEITPIPAAMAAIPPNGETKIGESAPTAQGQTESQIGLLDRIRGAAQQAYGRYKERITGAGKRGRGRPPNCAGCGQPETRCQCSPETRQSVGMETSPEMDAQALDDETVKEFAQCALETVTGTEAMIFTTMAAKKTDDRKYLADIVEKCRPSERQFASWEKFALMCWRKHSVKCEWLPEIGAGAVLGGVLLNGIVIYRDIASLPDKSEEKK